MSSRASSMAAALAPSGRILSVCVCVCVCVYTHVCIAVLKVSATGEA